MPVACLLDFFSFPGIDSLKYKNKTHHTGLTQRKCYEHSIHGLFSMEITWMGWREGLFRGGSRRLRIVEGLEGVRGE